MPSESDWSGSESSSQIQREEQEKDTDEWRMEQLSRTPAACPIGRCQHFIFPSGLMSHLRSFHDNSERGLVFRDAYESEPLRLKIPDLRGIDECDAPQCIAVLQFGGECNQNKSTPGCRLLCVPNTGLNWWDAKYEHYLPMLLMVSRSTWRAILPPSTKQSTNDGNQDKDKELPKKKTGGKRKNDGLSIFVLWLAAPVTVKPFYYTITVFSSSYDNSTSVLRKSRNFAHSQKPSDFLARDTDYLILRESEISVLVQPAKVNGHKQQLKQPKQPKQPGIIHIEIIVHELLNGPLTKQPAAAPAEKGSTELEAIPIIFDREVYTHPDPEQDDETSSQAATTARKEAAQPRVLNKSGVVYVTVEEVTVTKNGPNGPVSETISRLKATESSVPPEGFAGGPKAKAAKERATATATEAKVAAEPKPATKSWTQTAAKATERVTSTKTITASETVRRSDTKPRTAAGKRTDTVLKTATGKKTAKASPVPKDATESIAATQAAAKSKAAESKIASGTKSDAKSKPAAGKKTKNGPKAGTATKAKNATAAGAKTQEMKDRRGHLSDSGSANSGMLSGAELKLSGASSRSSSNVSHV